MNFISFFARANAVKQALQNPKKAGREALMGWLQGYAFIISLWVLVPLLVSGVLGFSTLFNGPYVFFEVVFYLLLLVIALVSFTIFTIYRKITNFFKGKKTNNKTTSFRSSRQSKPRASARPKVIDAEVVEDN